MHYDIYTWSYVSIAEKHVNRKSRLHILVLSIFLWFHFHFLIKQRQHRFLVIARYDDSDQFHVSSSFFLFSYMEMRFPWGIYQQQSRSWRSETWQNSFLSVKVPLGKGLAVTVPTPSPSGWPRSGPLRAWHLLCPADQQLFLSEQGFYAQGRSFKDIFSLVCKRNIFVSLVFSDSFMSLNKHSMT